MTRLLSLAAFALGAVIVLWMGAAFVGVNVLALLVTVLIAAAYSAGFVELLRYQQATDSLDRALNGLESDLVDLGHWLGQLHPSLKHAVRQRIQGEHIGLPAPVLTPYLVGLLVMLGLLGTFIGMVDTLKGAVMALEGSNELEAIRAGLAAPIQGLGMAFATSVAGVTASAMLGFISTLSRRQRLEASRKLDAEMGGIFRAHSLSYNRQQTYHAMQIQAGALPAVAEKLTVLAERLDTMASSLSDRLGQNQQEFHEQLRQRYDDLSGSVDQSLKQSLSDSGRLVGESIEPVLREFMQGLGREAQARQQQLAGVVETQISQLTKQFADTSTAVATAWSEGVTAHQRENAAQREALAQSLNAVSATMARTVEDVLQHLGEAAAQWQQQAQSADLESRQHWQQQQQASAEQWQNAAEELTNSSRLAAEQNAEKIAGLLAASEALVVARQNSEQQWLAGMEQRLADLGKALGEPLLALREAEQQRGDAAAEALAHLEETAAKHLSALGQSLEAPMQRLIETASETPKAAADVIAKLRAELVNTSQRDNELLIERQRIMEELNTLSSALQENTRGQGEAVQAMLDSSADQLAKVSEAFAERIDAQSTRFADLVDHFSGGTGELASLGETFTAAVQLFGESNRQWLDKLSGLEQSLQDAGARSDEQMAYYLAQAREIIDHNLLSQQELISQFRDLKVGVSTATVESEA